MIADVLKTTEDVEGIHRHNVKRLFTSNMIIPLAVAPATKQAVGLSAQTACNCFMLLGTIIVAVLLTNNTASSNVHFYNHI